MAKLADVTSEIRVGLKILGISLGIALAIFLFFYGGTIFKNLFFPTPPPPPAQKFGKLPKIEFPPRKPVSNVEYNINTLTGKLPFFKDRMNVYKVKRGEPSLVALQSIRGNLETIGFSQNETKINESTYQWGNKNQATIQYNLLTNNFKISSNFLLNPPSGLTNDISKKEDLYTNTISFLSSINEDTTDIDQNSSTVTYFKVENGQLVAADSQNQAQLARLDLFQTKLGDYKIYYPDTNQSTMHFTYGVVNSSSTIVDADFIHYPPDENNVSDYPIKTADAAFEDLQKGNALIFNESGQTQVDITNVSLGYYIGEEDQPYIMPIVIFSGKDFLAYVQAIPDSSIGN